MNRPGLAHCAVALVFLLVVLFGPSGGAASILGIVILAILVALGTWGCDDRSCEISRRGESGARRSAAVIIERPGTA